MTRTKYNKKPGPKRQFTDQQLKQTYLLALLGATNQILADFFDVDITTIEYWLTNYEDFAKARKMGGMEADMKVVQSLYKRATGYDYTEEELARIGAGLYRIKVRKHVVPDVKAAIHWLRNRQRENWTVIGDFNVNHQHGGRIEHTYKNLKDIPVNELSPEAQKLLFEIGSKSLAIDGARSREN